MKTSEIKTPISQAKEQGMCAKTMVLVAAVLAALGCALGSAQAVTWNAATDFSATNPSGQWSYGFTIYSGGVPDASGTYLLNNAYAPNEFGGAVDMWYRNDVGGIEPNVTHNHSADEVTLYGITWGPGAVGLASRGSYQYLSELRWTAPATGSYDLAATFSGMQSTGGADVYIYRNGTQLMTGTAGKLGDPGVSFSQNGLAMTAGDTLMYIVGTNGATGATNYVQLGATISDAPIPEPAMLTLLGLGALLLRRRK